MRYLETYNLFSCAFIISDTANVKLYGLTNFCIRNRVVYLDGAPESSLRNDETSRSILIIAKRVSRILKKSHSRREITVIETAAVLSMQQEVGEPIHRTRMENRTREQVHSR